MELYAGYREVKKAHKYLRYDAPDNVRLGYDALGKGLKYGGRYLGLWAGYGATVLPVYMPYKLVQSLWYVGVKGIDRTVAGILAAGWNVGKWGLSKCTTVRPNYMTTYQNLRGWLDWARPSRWETVEGWTPYGRSDLNHPNPARAALAAVAQDWMPTPNWRWSAPELPKKAAPDEAFNPNKVYRKGIMAGNSKLLADFNTWLSEGTVNTAEKIGASIPTERFPATYPDGTTHPQAGQFRYPEALRDLFEPGTMPHFSDVNPAVLAAAQAEIQTQGTGRQAALAAITHLGGQANTLAPATDAIVNPPTVNHTPIHHTGNPNRPFAQGHAPPVPAAPTLLDHAINEAVHNPEAVLKEAAIYEAAKTEVQQRGNGKQAAINNVLTDRTGNNIPLVPGSPMEKAIDAAVDKPEAFLKQAIVYQVALAEAQMQDGRQAAIINVLGGTAPAADSLMEKALNAAVANAEANWELILKRIAVHEAITFVKNPAYVNLAANVRDAAAKDAAIATLGVYGTNLQAGSDLDHAIDAAIAYPDTIISHTIERHKKHLDHLLTVTATNINNLMQRDFERQEAEEILNQVVKMYLKELYLEIKYGHLGYKSEHKGVIEKAVGRLFGLLQEVDPLFSRRQGSPLVI